MDEYVKRAAIMEFPIRKDHCDKERANEHFIFGIESVLEYVENLPAADVAPVVRCRDCIYTRKLYGGFVCKYGTCSGCFLREDFFCANGTRKETRKDGDSDALG